MSTELATSTPTTVKDFLALPAYKARFGEVLGQRAPQFMAALVSLSQQQGLSRCEPRSVIASAMVAATLDLPIEKSLGFAHVVPYGGVAQFQMAAKGYIQLALRSAQYQRINAKAINAEAFDGYDEVGEPRINWEQLDETKPTIGYVVAWKLTNGFTKIAYWPKTKVEAHAAKFSQAYKAKKQDSPWFTNFDKMALKTVVMNELRAWGILSVQMQTALRHDMAAQKDVDAEPEYVDGDTVDIPSVDGQPAATQAPAPERPAPPPRAKKGVNAVPEKTAEKPIDVETVPTATAATPAAKVEPIAEPAKTEPAPAATVEVVAPETPNPSPMPPVAPKPRTSLAAKEEITVTVKVEKLFAMMINIEGKPTPSVQAEVSGPFTGKVFHFGGATGDPQNIVASAPWAVGTSVALTIFGRLNAKTSQVMVVVKSVAEATPESPAMEVS